MFDLYDNPKYYEIAFSFRNIPAEVDLFEECFKRFSEAPVESLLELGCGNCPHMEELVKRGYEYNGLDSSKAMLDYSKEKALRIGAQINLIQGDMIGFSLESEVDFVYILLGSLAIKNTSELLSHFDSVGRVLKKGGLYLLDWCIQFEPPGGSEGKDSWETEQEGIRVKTTVSWKQINRVEQTFEETFSLEVNDHGNKFNLVEKGIMRAIYPQEFLCLVRSFKDFEFVGWWNNWNLTQPLEHASKIGRPITLIRRV